MTISTHLSARISDTEPQDRLFGRPVLDKDRNYGFMDVVPVSQNRSCVEMSKMSTRSGQKSHKFFTNAVKLEIDDYRNRFGYLIYENDLCNIFTAQPIRFIKNWPTLQFDESFLNVLFSLGLIREFY